MILHPQIPTDEWSWVERYLDVWARWMRHPGLQLEAPKRAPAFMGETRDGYGDPEEIHELAGQDRAIQVIEAALYGLSFAEQNAVMHIHLYAVFRFHRP